MLTKAKAQVLSNNYSVTPNCYIVIKDDSVLRVATEIGKNPSTGKIAHARVLHSFAGGDWVFFTFNYIMESLLPEKVLYAARLKLAVGENVARRKVIHMRPLLKRRQQQQQNNTTTATTTISSSSKTTTTTTTATTTITTND